MRPAVAGVLGTVGEDRMRLGVGWAALVGDSSCSLRIERLLRIAFVGWGSSPLVYRNLQMTEGKRICLPCKVYYCSREFSRNVVAESTL